MSPMIGTTIITTSDLSRHAWKFVLAGTAVACAVLLTTGWHSYRAVEMDTQQRLAAKARFVEPQVANLVRNANHVLDQIVTETARTGRCDPALIQHLARSYPEFRAISVNDRHGIIQCASKPEIIGMNRSIEDHAKQALAEPVSRSMVIEKPIQSRLSGAPILVMRRAIGNLAGPARFLAQITLDLRYFDRLLEPLTEKQQTLVLMHDSGTVLSRIPDPNRYRLLDISKSNAWEEHLQSGKTISSHREKGMTDGIERFTAIAEVSSQALSIAPRGKLLIGVGESVADAYAGWYRTAGALAFGCLLLAATIIALAIKSTRGQRGLSDRLEQQNRQLEELLGINQKFLNERNALDEHAIVSEADIRGKIIAVNRQFCEISGYTESELLGKSHSILNSRMHSPEFFRQMWLTISAGQPWHGLLCNRAKDGHLYWVKSSIIPSRNAKGYIDKYISFRTDVTPLVQTQEALERSQKDLIAAKHEAEHQHKLAEAANRKKSEFLASMSHELRTPMNAILGFSQIMQLEKLNPEQQDNIEQIYKSGRHLLRLINEVLDLSRIELGKIDLKMEPVALDELFKEALELIAPLAQRNRVTLELQPMSEQFFVRADTHRLQQVVLNLVANAVKYNRPQGTVTVAVQQQGKKVRISVIDTGIGLSPSDLKKLFTPYARFGPAHIEGTGIGLTITKQLVETMGGTIGVSSEKDHGSTFWVEFKQVSAPTLVASENSLASHDQNSASPQMSGTLLYIEDNQASQLMMGRALKYFSGLKLLTTASPQVGLLLATKQPPNLILLDINLPELNGFEVLQRLRDNPKTRHIPVIGVSASAMPNDVEKAKTAGFDDYLSKPVDIFSLRRVIRSHLQPRAA